MKSLHRLFAWILLSALLVTFGCSDIHRCVHADEPDVLAEQKAELWDKLLAARPETVPVSGESLTVTLIDVGQGDCILLVAPDGKTMLVDAGPVGSLEAIRTALAAQNVQSLDVVVATHPHADHIGSMAGVLVSYAVGMYVTIPQQQTDTLYTRVQNMLRDNGYPIVYPTGGQTIEWSDACTVTVLNPIAGYPDPEELNDASIVLRVQYGDTAVLLCGDAEELAEKRMLDTYPRSMLRADVLKLGHHGSSSSTGYAFFLAVSPDFAAASCGAGNDYGHPHLETLSLLYDTRTAFYRTDLDGSITFRLDGTNVSADPSRKETP